MNRELNTIERTELSSNELPVLNPDELSENGMLSPNGEWYPCHSGYHDMTCEQILSSNRHILEKSGWVFIINSEIFLAEPFDCNWTIPKPQWLFLREYIDKYPDPMSMFWELRMTNTIR